MHTHFLVFPSLFPIMQLVLVPACSTHVAIKQRMISIEKITTVWNLKWRNQQMGSCSHTELSLHPFLKYPFHRPVRYNPVQPLWGGEKPIMEDFSIRPFPVLAPAAFETILVSIHDSKRK